MPVVRFIGRSPDAALVRALARAKIDVVTGPRDKRDLRERGVVAIVAAAGVPAAPAPDASAPWIWLAPRPVAPRDARAAARAGAYDVIDASSPDAHAALVRRLTELDVNDPAPPETPTLVAKSPASRRMVAQIARAARTSMPVLLVGETGTGKDVAAHLIHAWSARAAKPFVPIHCAAIPNDLMEAELFGYTRGAFSGAVQSFAGQLVAATGGTVFLDEIDDTPYSTQVKLLRVLEDHVVTRIGESSPHKVDFRVVAATNRDLRALIDRGSFGADLYERLAIVTIQLPSLRERVEDLPALVDHMIERYYVEEREAAAGRGRPRVRRVSPHVHDALAAHAWTGNVRELRNAIFEALVYKRAGDELLVSDLPRRLLLGAPAAAGAGESGPDRSAALEEKITAGAFNLKNAVEELERSALRIALRRSSGNRAEAARMLGEVGRGTSSDPAGTVRAMMKRLGVRA